MLGGAVANAVNAVMPGQSEPFASGGAMPPTRSLTVSLVTVFIIFLIILAVGKYLWNNVLCSLVSVARPAKSVWQILGLAVLISLLSPGCC